MYKSTATQRTYHYPTQNQQAGCCKKYLVPLHIYPYFINAKKKNVVVIKCLKNQYVWLRLLISEYNCVTHIVHLRVVFFFFFLSGGKSFSLSVYFLKNWPNPETMFNTPGLIHVKQRLRPSSAFKPDFQNQVTHSPGAFSCGLFRGRVSDTEPGPGTNSIHSITRGSFSKGALMSRRRGIPPEAGDPLLIPWPVWLLLRMTLCRRFSL